VEDRIEEANERNRAKYAELVNGWRARCKPIEVECRGFTGQSLYRVYNTLGITGASRRRAMMLVTKATEVASRWLWIRAVGGIELPGHKPGLDQPWLGRLEESV